MARATPAQLPIYPPRFVPLGTDHHQAAFVRHAGPELNVGAAAGHVRRNRDRARLTGARHDFRLLHMILGVQHVVRNFFTLEHSAEQLARLHTDRADQHRLLPRVTIFDLVDDGIVFLTPRLVDAIVGIFALHWPVRRNDVDVELVNVVEFVRLGLGRASHTGELFIKPEIILNRNGGQRLRLAIDLHAFLCFNRLMQTVAPAAPRHFAPGELIDNHDFVIFNDVLNVFFEQAVCSQ